MPHPVIFDRRLLRARRARAAALGAGDVPARPRGRRSRRAAVRGAAAIRSRRRSRHADRCGAPRARRSSRHDRAVDRLRHGGGDSRSSPTRRRCRSATPRSISSCPRWRLQFVNDLPGTLIQIRRALKPDGLFLAAHDRRRQPRRIARSLRRRPRPKSKAACRRASRRSPTCAISARCCSARASRCRSPTSTGSRCATPRRSR